MNLIETYHPDIIFGTESWLNPDISSCELFPEGYSVYSQDRKDGYGGVFIACRKSLISCSLEPTNNFCEVVAYKIKLFSNGNLIVRSAYRPPSSNDDYLVNLCKHLEFIKNSHPNSAFWLAGDVNLPDINWIDNCIEGHQYLLNTNNVLEFLNINGLSQMVNSPTIGSNILDIFMTNRPSLIESCTVIDGISDHEAVYLQSL